MWRRNRRDGDTGQHDESHRFLQPEMTSILFATFYLLRGLPWGLSVIKESACQCRSSISGSGRSPGEGNGKPLQYTSLGKPMDREAWQATVHRVEKESDKNKIQRFSLSSVSGVTQEGPSRWRVLEDINKLKNRFMKK